MLKNTTGKIVVPLKMSLRNHSNEARAYQTFKMFCADSARTLFISFHLRNPLKKEFTFTK